MPVTFLDHMCIKHKPKGLLKNSTVSISGGASDATDSGSCENSVYVYEEGSASLISESRREKERDKDWPHQLWECSVLSWLTITNLGRGRTAAVFRTVSSIFWTMAQMAHSLSLGWILIVFNSCSSSNIEMFGEPVWSYLAGLALVQDLFTLNILLVSTLCLGWVSLVLDVIIAAVKYGYFKSCDDQVDRFVLWEEAILLEGIKY